MTDITPTCDTCLDAPPFECFAQCIKCAAAIVVARPGPWASNRKFYVGTPWLPVFDREVERQRSAVMDCGLQRAVSA